jgi:hypothetical protein
MYIASTSELTGGASLYYISGGMLMRYIPHTSFSDRETEQQLCYFVDYNKSEKDDLSLLKDTKYLSSTVWIYTYLSAK